MARMAFTEMRRTISLIPIGLTPGHLSSAISRQAVNAGKPEGSTYAVQIRLPSLASASQWLEEAPRKKVHKRLQPRASMPEGSAASSVLSAVVRIREPVSWSKVTGWGSLVGGSGGRSADEFKGWPMDAFPVGCLVWSHVDCCRGQSVCPGETDLLCLDQLVDAKLLGPYLPTSVLRWIVQSVASTSHFHVFSGIVVE